MSKSKTISVDLGDQLDVTSVVITIPLDVAYDFEVVRDEELEVDRFTITLPNGHLPRMDTPDMMPIENPPPNGNRS